LRRPHPPDYFERVHFRDRCHSVGVTSAALIDIYTAEVRRWLADNSREPNVAHGLMTLRRMLQLLIEGLQPRPATRSA
jgi:hypothetical protein